MNENVVKLENNFNQVIERKIAVIFVTDVVGFSKLMEIDEDETLKNFRACRDILDNLFSEYGGRIFNTAGDSVLAEFHSAVSAVVCASEFQKLIKERNMELDENDIIIEKDADTKSSILGYEISEKNLGAARAKLWLRASAKRSLAGSAYAAVALAAAGFERAVQGGRQRIVALEGALDTRDVDSLKLAIKLGDKVGDVHHACAPTPGHSPLLCSGEGA